jgi:hypothetical protein
MSLRRTAQIVAALGLIAVGVWIVRGKMQEPLSDPAEVTQAGSKIRPRSAADIIAQLAAQPMRARVTMNDVVKNARAGKAQRLSQPEVESFLKNQGRSAANLLVAGRMLNDLKYAREAAKADPKNPLPQLELALRGETPEERSAAIAAFRAAAPDNSLGDYLAADQAFRSGDTSAASEALLKSLESPRFITYDQAIVDSNEQAFLGAGYEPQAASFAAMDSVYLSHLKAIHTVTENLVSLQAESIRAADFRAAEQTLAIGLTLGQRMQDQRPNLLEQMMGMSIETRLLNQLDPLTPVGPGGQTAGGRLEALAAKRLELEDLARRFEPAFATADDATQSQLVSKMKDEGHLAAMRWLMEKK